jgi:hypothetical protein
LRVQQQNLSFAHSLQLFRTIHPKETGYKNTLRLTIEIYIHIQSYAHSMSIVIQYISYEIFLKRARQLLENDTIIVKVEITKHQTTTSYLLCLLRKYFVFIHHILVLLHDCRRFHPTSTQNISNLFNLA